MRSDGSGRGRRSNSSSRGGHGAGRGGRGPRPGLQAAERLGKAGPGAGGAAPLRLALGPLCGPERAGAATEAPPRLWSCAGQARRAGRGTAAGFGTGPAALRHLSAGTKARSGPEAPRAPLSRPGRLAYCSSRTAPKLSAFPLVPPVPVTGRESRSGPSFFLFLGGSDTNFNSDFFFFTLSGYCSDRVFLPVGLVFIVDARY